MECQSTKYDGLAAAALGSVSLDKAKNGACDVNNSKTHEASFHLGSPSVMVM